MLVYICLFLLIIVLLKKDFSSSIKETIICSALGFCGILTFFTEAISALKLLNATSVIIFWSLCLLILIFILLKDRRQTVISIVKQKMVITSIYHRFKFYEKLLVWIIIGFLILLLFQGIIYPPNNWDSLTYHMSRIIYWIGNESVSHFPTHILRHLYQPPFAEYFIMNINLINGNDYLSNSVQWTFLILTIISIWAILDFFKINWSYKLLSAFLLITIPSVELQSSTTKNDIVCGFFVITSLYFALKCYYDTQLKNFVFLGLAIGLGMLTKGTTYIFLTPILLLFTIFISIKLIKNIAILKYGISLVGIILLLNVSHFYRNYKINGNVLNIDKWEADTYPNSEMNAKLLASNFLKNVGLHVGYPLQTNYDAWIKKVHKKYNVDINNPATNFLATPYYGPKEFETAEDLVPNAIHLPLIALSFILIFIIGIFKIKKYKKELLLLFVLLFQILLFVGYLKWQPWHTRLHIPIFMLSVVLITLTASRLKLFLILILYCIPYLNYNFYFNFVYNNIRPIITNPSYTKNIKIGDNRFKKYFSNQLQLYPEYARIEAILYNNSPKKVGLFMADWEYPLFNAYYYDKIQLRGINVTNITKKIPQETDQVDLIISTVNSKDILYNNKRYINKTPFHTHLWIYK
jgi:4-amino-4-deoxy-L-arabinose transferase-like glycosyltransferase